MKRNVERSLEMSPARTEFFGRLVPPQMIIITKRAEEREPCGLQPRARILRLGARRHAARINIIAGDRRQKETATTTASATMTR